MRHHRGDHVAMSGTVSLVLMLCGCMMIAGPLTLVYCSKLKQRRLQQGLANRINQYTTSTQDQDRNNFVAQEYDQNKAENVLNPKFLQQ